jgi:hypothetical protein
VSAGPGTTSERSRKPRVPRRSILEMLGRIPNRRDAGFWARSSEQPHTAKRKRGSPRLPGGSPGVVGGRLRVC